MRFSETHSEFDQACDAAHNGDVAALTRILDVNNVAKQHDAAVGTVLHFASTAEVVDLLLNRGADIEAKNARGMTPLQVKAEYGLIDVARCLIENGSRLDAGSHDRIGPPIFLAVTSRQYVQGMVDLLRKHTKTLELRSAVVLFDIKAVQGLLAADPSAVKRSPWRDDLVECATVEATFLSERVLPKDAPRVMADARCMIQLLVKAGAPVDAIGSSGECPLHWAVYRESRPLAEILLDNGADGNTKSLDGETLLESAKGEEFRSWMKTKLEERRRKQASE